MYPRNAVMLALILALPLLAHARSEPKLPQKAILVTGASTGIGRKVTERLAADGYFVYAGARKDSDIEALRHYLGGKMPMVWAATGDCNAHAISSDFSLTHRRITTGIWRRTL